MAGLATVRFTANLQRFVRTDAISVQAKTLRAALDAVSAERPEIRGYILDDQGSLRKHIMVFIDGQIAEDRDGLSDAIASNAEIYVMQALSGG